MIGRQGRSPRYDIVGVFVLAVALGLAGGISRDLMIGNTPVVATRTPWYIVTVIGVTLLVIVAGRHSSPTIGRWCGAIRDGDPVRNPSGGLPYRAAP